MSKSEVLRKDLESKSILKVGGAFDAMSAKLVEINGFDAVWAGLKLQYLLIITNNCLKSKMFL